TSSSVSYEDLFEQRPRKTQRATPLCSATGGGGGEKNFLLRAEALGLGGKAPPPAVNDEDFMALFSQQRNLPGEFMHNGIAFKQCSRKFDDESHCSPVVSSSCDNRLKF